MDNGLNIVLSPVQLAAVLSDESVTEAETLSNRILGGVGIVLGAVELAGATTLCIVPEPTGLTKVGCVVVGAHSLDSINAAADQLLTGRDVRTATHQLAVKFAQELGADNVTAYNIGMSVDIAVPAAFGFSIGALRCKAVRSGQFKLAEHEAVAGAKKLGGGHTIAKHVGKSDEEMLVRLGSSLDAKQVSSFVTLEQAEKFISAGLKTNKLKIMYWFRIKKDEQILELSYRAATIVGYGFRKGISGKLSTSIVRIVLRRKFYNGKPYFILTAYPDLTGIL